MARLTGNRAITSLTPPPNPDALTRDRFLNGSGSTRIAALLKEIDSSWRQGDFDVLERILERANLPRILRLIAEDSWANYDKPTAWRDGVSALGPDKRLVKAFDGGKGAREALLGLFKRLAATQSGRSYSRARTERDRQLGPMERLAEEAILVLETKKQEPGTRARVALLSRKLKANPHLLDYWVDGKREARDPVSEARHLLKDLVPFLDMKSLRSKAAILRYLRLTARALRKRADNSVN